MHPTHHIRRIAGAVLGVASLTLAGCAGLSPGSTVNVQLRGSEEVPPVSTSATGNGTITIHPDKSVTGGVTTFGMNGGMAAHIHQGARGQNGPISVGLVKSGDNGWAVPAGAKLTDAQYDAFRAGNLYVNVHTPANKGGEIRGQLNP